MMEYSEESYLQLSGIQHFEFCKRQWALIHIEEQWAENVRTVEGELMHEVAHEDSFTEKRRDLIMSRGMPVFSRTLGISGQCDVVEFRRCEKGVFIPKYNGKYDVYPVEYKHGKPKNNDCDVLQLTAQAICLEEMLSFSILKGCIFYGETRKRLEVNFTEELRENVIKAFNEMHSFVEKKYTPKVKRKRACNACSLNNICMPSLMKAQNVNEYINKRIGEI